MPTHPFTKSLPRLLLVIFLGSCVGLTPCWAQEDPRAPEAMRLQVADNQRYLEYTDGTPFFYLGDTAWELFHRLDQEEAARYLQNRAGKGFTVIQAVVLAQLGGLDDPNPYGATPLEDNDPDRPNEAYFQHVDAVVDEAERLGLFIALLPTWGSHWNEDENGATGIFTTENAAGYGRFLGERYRDEPIIWVLGGDENAVTDNEVAVIEAMAAGLREGDGGTHLITFHPRGPGQSSSFFHDAAWLDFNMSQSSHAASAHDTGLFSAGDYARTPTKPTLDAEPRYEMIPVGFYNVGSSGLNRFDAYDVRLAAYWSLMAGACGHTYGHNSVWQMWAPGRQPIIRANVPWYEALDHPGAFQMKHVRTLYESRPYQKLAPAEDFVVDGPMHGAAKIRAALAEDGSFAFVYSPRGEPFTVRVDALNGRRIRTSWYDPRYGVTEVLHTTDTPSIQTFVPPSSGKGNDWILILDDEAAGFPLPGVAEP